MICPSCQNFLPPGCRFCPFCGEKMDTVPTVSGEAPDRPAKFSPKTAWLAFGALLLVLILSCIILIWRGGLPHAGSETENNSQLDPEISADIYYAPEGADIDGSEATPNRPELEHIILPGLSSKDKEDETEEAEAPPFQAEETVTEAPAQTMPAPETTAREPAPPAVAPEAAPPAETTAAESEPVYTITATPLSGTIAVGESMDFYVTHNYPGAKVYLGADNFGQTTGRYSQSYHWYDFSADFTITGLTPGVVLISFFYEDAEHNFIRSEQITVNIVEAEGPLDPEIQQTLDMLDELGLLENEPAAGEDPVSHAPDDE